MKKTIKILLTLAIIIILAVLVFIFWNNNTINNENVDEIKYPDTSIFYENNNQIWQFNPRTEIKNKIAIGIAPSVSPDKTKLVYIYKHTETAISEVHILDIKTNVDKILKHFDNEIALAVYNATWSPDGKYLIVDAGTSPIRNKMVIDAISGDDVISFSAYKSAWLNNNEIVYNEPQGTYDFRPYGSGKGSGISIINIDGKKKTLKEATLKKDYIFKQFFDGKIYFILAKVKSYDEWTDNNKQDISYWTIDKNGNNLTQMEEILILGNEVEKKLPIKYKEYKGFSKASFLNVDENWFIFILNKRQETTLKNEIFIMNINQPDSIKKIDNGSLPSW